MRLTAQPRLESPEYFPNGCKLILYPGSPKGNLY